VWLDRPAGGHRAGRFPDAPPGFVAGFTTREIVSDRAGVTEVPRALARSLGIPEAEVIRLSQVHGRDVLEATGVAEPGGDRLLGAADAVISRANGRLLTVFTADCVPILLADPKTGWMAAVHAGWRGTALQIVDAVLDQLALRGVAASSLYALFGPSISGPSYEVGPEVVGALRAAFHDRDLPRGAVLPGREDRYHVDLAFLNEALLLERGVRPARISRAARCTATESNLFPSYRRDGPGTGRIATGIARTRP
jgi:YfiH family protein